MAGRRLDAEESALWRKVTASVRPLRAGLASSAAPAPLAMPHPQRRVATPSSPQVSAGRRPASTFSDTLDGGWDRRLRRGIIQPDAVIDLHGHTLASAHAALDTALARAVANDHRVLLVVTGRPPRPGREGRGLIRASVGDWLLLGRHASRIAAVRNAHPRHGGPGALYVVLRRRREHPARNC